MRKEKHLLHIVREDEYDIVEPDELTDKEVKALNKNLDICIADITSRSSNEVFSIFVILKVLYQNNTPPTKDCLSRLSLNLVNSSSDEYRDGYYYFGLGHSRAFYQLDDFIDKLMICVNSGYSPPLGFIANIYSHNKNIAPYLIKFVKNIKLSDLEGIDANYDTKINLLLSEDKTLIPSFDLSKEEILQYLASPTICGCIVDRLIDTRDIVISYDIIDNIAQRCSSSTLQNVIAKGGKYSNGILETICNSPTSALYRSLLNDKLILIFENKIEPANKALYILLDNAQPKYCTNYVDKIFKFDKIIRDSIEIFIRYGYEFTYNDMLYALSKGVVIKNIERFNFNFDVSYTTLCVKIKQYPYSVSNAKGNMLSLLIQCQNGYLSDIRKIIKKHKR